MAQAQIHERKKSPARRSPHAAALKAAREKQGRTLAQVAAATGWSLTTISNVENGHDRPSQRMLKALAGELGLTLPTA